MRKTEMPFKIELAIQPMFYALLMGLGWLAGIPAAAGPGPAGPGPAGPGPGTHALTSVRIVVSPGVEIEGGSLVLRDGVIEAVGADIEIPPEAQLWERENLTVYAGWIETYSVAPWPQAESGAQPQGGHPNALVTPERDMTLHGYDEARARKLRQAGFTSAVVAPESGLLRGQSIVLNLGEGTLGENLLRRGLAQHVSLSEVAEDGYPSSLMGGVALTRQTFYDALWYAEAQAAFGRRRSQNRPSFDLSLEALAAAAQGQQLVIFESEDMLGTLRAMGLADELSLDAWIVGSGDEYKRLAEIAATPRPLLLPLAFPDPPEVGEEDNLNLDLEDLRHWRAAPDNPRLLLAADMTLAFTSFGLSEPKEIHRHLHRAIEQGLDPQAALAAVTTTPARLLGMSELLGTVEAGKLANLLVVEGDLFIAKPKIREVWVDGQRYEIKELKPPEVDPVGTWAVVIDAGPDGKIPVQLVIQGEVGDLKGTIGSSAGSLPLGSVEVSGKVLEASFDSTPFGMPGMIQLKLTIDGDSAKGSGTSPQGPFRLSGKRQVTADPEVER